MNKLLEQASKKELLSAAEASALLGESELVIRRAIKNQELMYVPGTRGGFHVTKESFLRWLRSRESYYVDEKKRRSNKAY